MFRLYSERAAARIVKKLEEPIRAICARYPLPVPALQAVLLQEITQIDLFDPLADALVWLNGARLALCERLTDRALRLPNRRGLLYKFDSSTGYAQIYAFVGIAALHFGCERGLCRMEDYGFAPEESLDAALARDRRRVWLRLRRDRRLNLELAALNLLSAAEEVTGRIDFASFTPEELQRIFTRYNSSRADRISAYGRAVYARYLRLLA